MQVRLIARTALAASLLVSFAAYGYDYTAPVPLHTVANFDPAHGVIPFPNDLLLNGTTDLTLNIPVADAADFGDPKVAMNALDGFSTVAPWSTGFSTPLDAGSLVGGQSVRVFEVTLSGPGGAVTGVTRELSSPGEFVVALAPSDASGRTLAIVPTKPLKERTSYMAVLTKDIKDAGGGSVRGSLVYTLATGHNSLCSDGHSTLPALPASQACALEPLRQLVNSQVAAAESAGVAPGNVAMSWVMTTQSITPTMQALTAITAAGPAATTHIAPSGRNLGNLGAGLPPVADIYLGTIDLPYYLTAPGSDNPTAALTGFWQANAGAYIPQCAAFGLDPTSTNLTACNPVPAATSTQTVPLLLTLPNAASHQNKPAAGWPVVIFEHGITRNRTDMFAIAGTLAAQGFAVVAIDQPLHGITDPSNPFYIGNTPFAALGAHERTFDLDLEDNTTGAPGPDGHIDPSGSYFINLSSLLTSRDNLRQAEADLLTLSHSISGMQLPGGANLDASRVTFVGQSLGSIVGTVFLSLDPNVTVGVVNVPGGGIARMLDASPTFGPRIRAGLAAAGVEPGTADYDAFMAAAQTAVDSADPINYAALNAATPGRTMLLQEVIGSDGNPPDQVIPNTVPGAPLSGTEPLIAALRLYPVSQTILLSTGGLRGASRFLQGEHGSLLDPTDYPAVTAEMQGEMASFLSSNGNAVIVRNPSLLEQIDCTVGTPDPRCPQ